MKFNSQNVENTMQPVYTRAHTRVGESNDDGTNTHIVFMHVLGKKNLCSKDIYVCIYIYLSNNNITPRNSKQLINDF